MEGGDRRGGSSTSRPRHSVLLVLLHLLPLVLLPAVCLGSSPLFEDASAASSFGSSNYIYNPWAGTIVSDISVADLDGDGIAEILISGQQSACSAAVDGAAVLFVRDAVSRKYRTTTSSFDFIFSYHKPLSRTGAASVSDLVVCMAGTVTVLENRGALNFTPGT